MVLIFLHLIVSVWPFLRQMLIHPWSTVYGFTLTWNFWIHMFVKAVPLRRSFQRSEKKFSNMLILLQPPKVMRQWWWQVKFNISFRWNSQLKIICTITVKDRTFLVLLLLLLNLVISMEQGFLCPNLSLKRPSVKKPLKKPIFARYYSPLPLSTPLSLIAFFSFLKSYVFT